MKPTVRTSTTHPLQIAEVAAPGGGAVGVTFCPGKHQAYAATGAWARDLETDLQAIRAWGAGVVLTLVTPAELKELKVERLGETARSLGMQWLHLPIVDVSTPDMDWLKAWDRDRRVVHEELDRGRKVLVHCKGGLGRAGTIASLILTERGVTAERAIASVRAVRPGALETSAQERFVHAHEHRWTPPVVRCA